MNWPEVMYYLHPPQEWIAFRGAPLPAQRRDAQNNLMFERFPRQGLPARPLLDFPILPDRVSLDLPTQVSFHNNTSYRSAAVRSFGGSSCGGGWIPEYTGRIS